MSMAVEWTVRLIKAAIGVAIAGLGWLVLDPVRWAAFKAAPLSLTIPAEWYSMRLERLWIGGTILLLGVLCALVSVKPGRS